MGEVLDIAVELDIIKKSGSWFSYDGNKIGQGKEKVKVFLKENPDILKEIEDKIMNNKDALEAVGKSVTGDSELEQAAQQAAENSDSLTADMDDFAMDPVANAEEDFEEFTPAD